ncbi:MAG: hypothetical protein RQM92_13750 [Candidatus Syntrophopropionicum ammoniitolerans]
MQGLKKGFIAGALLLFAFMMLFSNQAHASQNNEKAAKEVMIDFFNAVKNNDIDNAINNSVDKFYKNENERREAFQAISNDLKYYKIESVNEADANKVIIMVEISWNNGDYDKVSYPVVRRGGKWIIDISNANADAHNLLEEYQGQDLIVYLDAEITPAVTSGITGVAVGTYEFAWLYDDYSNRTSPSFYINTGVCSISGYQSTSDYGAQSKIRYWVAKKVALYWQELPGAVIQSGNGSYVLNFTNMPQSTQLAVRAYSAASLNQNTYGGIYDGY